MIKFFKKLFKTNDKTIFISMEESMREDMATLDKTNPNWDIEVRVSDAIAQIKHGKMRESVLNAIYGKEVLELARQRIIEKKTE